MPLPAAMQSLNQDEGKHEDVLVEHVESCFLCGKQGAPLYTGLRDKLFSAPGVWQLVRCPKCGLVWLTPQPVGSEFRKLYDTYYTHADDQRSWRRLARD